MTSIDAEQGSRRGLPRPSRLPRAISSIGSTIADTTHDRTSQHVNQPYPATLRTKTSGLLRNDVDNDSGMSRFGWHRASDKVSLTTAPSTSTIMISPAGQVHSSRPIDGADHVPESFDSDAVVNHDLQQNFDLRAGVTKDPTKKKPRPSLSERTIETLSSIPTSPSPSRRKSSFSQMGPPLRPPSATRLSRPTSPSSPSRHLMRPPSRPASPVKDVAFTSLTRPTIGSRTPSKQMVRERAIRPCNTPASAQRSASNSSNVAQKDLKASPRSTHSSISAHRVRSLHDLKAAATKQVSRKPSLNFKDTPTTPVPRGHLKFRGQQQDILVSKVRSPSGADPSTPGSRLKKRSSFTTGQSPKGESSLSTQAGGKPSAKSSFALRETIARAKALKREAVAGAVQSKGSENPKLALLDEFIDDGPPEAVPGGSLKRRIVAALSTGTLNAAALGLKTVPNEIMNMYDADLKNWAETVDLTKLILADNEIEVLSDRTFPDWTMEELMDDDEKTNIFGGLETLDLRGNKLRELPVGIRQLELLHTLKISNNELSSDAFEVISQMKNLRDLSLANNRIVGMLPDSIGRLEKLHALDLHGNKITSLGSAFKSLVNLQRLNISENQLIALPLNDLCGTALIELNAAKNGLVGTIFDENSPSFEKLKELNIANNQVQVLSDASLHLPQLQTLIVDNNKLRSLPNLAGLATLTTLTASENSLEEIPEAFIQLQSLRTANFSGNNIRGLDPYISKMENLSVLNLAGNPIRDRKYLTMSTSDLKLELSKRLTAVLVQNDARGGTSVDIDQLNAMLDGTASIDEPKLLKPEKGVLNLTSHDLESLEPSLVDLSDSVHTIQLADNQLAMFPIDLLIHPSVQPNLRHLDLSQNISLQPLNYLPHPIYLPALQSLYVSSTGLASLEPLTDNLSAPGLRELNISNHRLTGPFPELKFSFPNLTTLIATDNRFESITADSIKGLEVVDIRNNEIESLPPKIGELGNVSDKRDAGRLRLFEVSGNRFRVPRLAVIEKGTEAVLADLRRMVNSKDIGDEWRE